MKRILIRPLSICLALVLGWYAAGLSPASWNVGVSLAQEHAEAPKAMQPHAEPASHGEMNPDPADPLVKREAARRSAEAESGQPEASASAAHGEAGDDQQSMEESAGVHDRGGAEGPDAGQKAAAQLMPHTEEAIAWYRPVVMGIVALFAAALVLGYAALKFKGTPPPDPADDPHDDDGHGDHAKQDGGHGHDDHGHQPAADGHGH